MQGAARRLTRRAMGQRAGVLGAGVAGLAGAACAGPGNGPTTQSDPQASARRADLRVHVVKKLDVSDWIEQGLQQNIDDWKTKNPNINVTMELHGAWTDTYFPQVIAISASGQLGDLVWYPPRHRSHIAWGTKYGIVRDLTPLARGAKYDMGQFYKGANEQNTHEGKQYWLSYISEPIVPVIAYNKSRLQQIGVPAPADDWTFDDLAEFARRSTTANTFGYFRGSSGTAPFGAAPYLRQWGVEPVDASRDQGHLHGQAGGLRAGPHLPLQPHEHLEGVPQPQGRGHRAERPLRQGAEDPGRGRVALQHPDLSQGLPGHPDRLRAHPGGQEGREAAQHAQRARLRDHHRQQGHRRGLRLPDLDRREGDERAGPGPGLQGPHRPGGRVGGPAHGGQVAGLQEAAPGDGDDRAGLPGGQLQGRGVRHRRLLGPPGAGGDPGARSRDRDPAPGPGGAQPRNRHNPPGIHGAPRNGRPPRLGHPLLPARRDPGAPQVRGGDAHLRHLRPGRPGRGDR